jgi:cell shape-determining protein MreD
MKKILILIVSNLILALMQLSFFPNLISVQINLVLALSMAFFMIGSNKASIQSAFVGGLILDLFGIDVIGISPLVFILFIMIFNFVRNHTFNSWYFNLFLVFLASISYTNVMSLPIILFNKNVIIEGIGSTIVCGLFYLFLLRYRGLIESSSYFVNE